MSSALLDVTSAHAVVEVITADPIDTAIVDIAIAGTAFARADEPASAHGDESTVLRFAPAARGMALGWSNVLDLQRRLGALVDIVSVTRLRATTVD
jgi:hypothetical protein